MPCIQLNCINYAIAMSIVMKVFWRLLRWNGNARTSNCTISMCKNEIKHQWGGVKQRDTYHVHCSSERQFNLISMDIYFWVFTSTNGKYLPIHFKVNANCLYNVWPAAHFYIRRSCVVPACAQTHIHFTIYIY